MVEGTDWICALVDVLLVRVGWLVGLRREATEVCQD